VIQHEDGTVSLEKGERIDLQREIDWIVQDWMPDDRYVGALVFGQSGRVEYMLFPYDETVLRASA
jgi:hypothetical protein